tara:strand:+ start:10141 stop:12444 length:2304 start_codon:yes stop_codon:yes gene_type:complete
MTDLGTIENYKRIGVNLVPIPKGAGKSLTMKGWQKYCDEMWIGDVPVDQDFAVMLGKASGNLVVLDFDKCNDIDILNDVVGNCINRTLVVRSGNGYHIYLRVKEVPPGATVYLHKEQEASAESGKLGNVSFNLEIKSHGSYVIGASSDHYDKDEDGRYFRTGKTYTVVSNRSEILELSQTGSELIDIIKDKGWIGKDNVVVGEDGTYIEKESIADLVKRKWNKGERHNMGYRVALHRFHAGWEYEKVMDEANAINSTCCAENPHTESEVTRWVNDGYAMSKKNASNPDSTYFKGTALKVTAAAKAKQEKDDELSEVADELLQEYHFKTYKDTEELLVFNGKVYEGLNAESIVREYCEQNIERCQMSHCNEVIAKIKRRSYVIRDHFNAYPNIITLENGILNLKTMEFRDHDHRNLSTWYIPTNYPLDSDGNTVKEPDGDINYSAIEKQLKDTVFWKYIVSCFTDEKTGAVNQTEIYTVLETMAFTLLKTNTIQRSVMFIGSGSNGKSVLLEYLDNIIGSRNITHIPIQDLAEGKFIIARLDGKRVNIFADVESTEMRKSGQLKTIIGGEPIEVQRKHEHPYTMVPTCKFIFSANRFPRVYDQSDGNMRRFMIVRFDRQFTGLNKDTTLGKRLADNTEEKEMVFGTMVSLARQLHRRGDFRYPRSINDIRLLWNEMADPILQFVNSRVDEVADSLVTKKDVYADYYDYCTRNEMTPMKIGAFGKEFSNHFDEQTVRTDQSVRKYWSDMKLKPRNDPETDENQRTLDDD